MPNAKNTIVLDDRSNIRDEAQANAALYPGYLLEKLSTGKVRAHATAGGSWGGHVALEDALQGNGVDDAYAANDLVFVATFRKGDKANLVLADGETIVIGDLVESAGDGTIRKLQGESSAVQPEEPNSIVGEANEALDLSASSGAESSGLLGDRRISIKIW